MSTIRDRINNFVRRRNQETSTMSIASLSSSFGFGYNINNYFVEDSNKIVTQDNSGINLGTSEKGQVAEAHYGAWSSLLIQLKGEFFPVFFLKAISENSLLNRLVNRIGVALSLALNSEIIKGKVVEEIEGENVKVADSYTTMRSSLRYSLNLLLIGTFYGVKLGLGVNLLGYNNYGKSRMNKYGRFPVVELSGIVKTFRSIDLGLGLIFLDGTLFANLIFGLTKFKRFLGNLILQEYVRRSPYLWVGTSFLRKHY